MLNRKSQGWVIKMSTISNECLEKLSEYDCADRYEVMSMATELLALRKERERAEPMFYVDGDAAKRLMRGHTRFATITTEPKAGPSLPLYIVPPPAQVVADVDPSLDAMMRALDAFYADGNVPERAMLAAFKILLADVIKQ